MQCFLLSADDWLALYLFSHVGLPQALSCCKVGIRLCTIVHLLADPLLSSIHNVVSRAHAV